MDETEIAFTLKDGIEELLNRTISYLMDDYEFRILDPSTQLEKARVEMYQEIRIWADWEYKNAQVNLHKLIGRMD